MDIPLSKTPLEVEQKLEELPKVLVKLADLSK
jgi:hypothetical protein